MPSNRLQQLRQLDEKICIAMLGESAETRIPMMQLQTKVRQEILEIKTHADVAGTRV